MDEALQQQIRKEIAPCIGSLRVTRTPSRGQQKQPSKAGSAVLLEG